MEQCHSIEKSTDNIETEDRETDVGSSTADAKPSDNSAEQAEVVEEECHQKVIHELTKDSEVIQKEETQTIDVDDVSHCSHGSICEPDKQNDDIIDTDTKDIENDENKEDAVAQEDKSISKCDESAVAKDTSLAEDKSEQENAPETVENSSKDEAEAATELDKHSSVEDLANKETYEAVYSDILQPQEHVPDTEKDVSEADKEKDTSETEKEESVNKDNSLADDKSEKETTPEIIVDSFEKEKDSSMAENDKDTSEAEKDKSEDKNTSEADKQPSEEKETSEAEKETSDDKDTSLVDEKSEKETAPEIAADSYETDKFHPIPGDKSPIEFPKYGTEFGSKESSMAEKDKLSKEADNEADTEKDISEADERDTSEAEKDKSVSKDTSLADEKSEKETVPEITDDSLTKEKDSSMGENAKEAEKEEHASEDKSEKDIAPETVDESSKDKAEAATELDKHSSAEDLVDKSKYLKEMNVNEPHL